MKKLALLLLTLTLTSCTSVSTPMNGMIYTEATGPTAATSNRLVGKKTGEACGKSIFGVAMGDTTITTAAKEGNIKKITHVDHKVKSILGVYVEYCTVVYGN